MSCRAVSVRATDWAFSNFLRRPANVLYQNCKEVTERVQNGRMALSLSLSIRAAWCACYLASCAEHTERHWKNTATPTHPTRKIALAQASRHLDLTLQRMLIICEKLYNGVQLEERHPCFCKLQCRRASRHSLALGRCPPKNALS